MRTRDVVAVLCLLGALACRGEPAPEETSEATPEPAPTPAPEPPLPPDLPPAETLPDVLIVILDTTGPGVVASHMPNAQAFLDGARTYTDAIAPSNSTMETVAGVFLGTPMSNARLWDEGTKTLPERLTRRGFHGWIGSANPVLDHPFYARGFEQTRLRLQDIRPDFPDEGLIDHFEGVWASLERPRFGWLHLAACHDYRIAKKNYIDEGWARGPEARAEAWDAYVLDCAATDALLPRVFAANEGGLTVLTADHGELFAQYGAYALPSQDEHGHGLSDSPMEIHVPLGLQGPGIEPAKIPGPTSLLDLHSTVLGLAGLPVRGGDLLTGEGLRPAISAGCDVYGTATMSYGARVRDDGTHAVRVDGPRDVPGLFTWTPGDAVGLQPVTAASLADLDAVEQRALFNEAKLECVDDQELCRRHPEIASLGYIECGER